MLLTMVCSSLFFSPLFCLTHIEDENREFVLDHFEILITRVKEEELAFTAFAVMLNLCNDFGKPCHMEKK